MDSSSVASVLRLDWPSPNAVVANSTTDIRVEGQSYDSIVTVV